MVYDQNVYFQNSSRTISPSSSNNNISTATIIGIHSLFQPLCFVYKIIVRKGSINKCFSFSLIYLKKNKI